MLSLLPLAALAMTAQDDGGWRQARVGAGYELAHGAQPDILLQCTPGRRTIKLNVDGMYTGDGPEPRRLRIASGRTRTTVPLRFDGNADRGGSFAADLPLGSPVLTAFGLTGRLTLDARNVRIQGDARTAPERAVIAGFVTFCRQR